MASAPATVHVTGISSATSEKEVRDFFSFCGKISNLSVTKETSGNQTAAVTFEKSQAAKTALLLDNTQLKDNLVQVSSASTLEELSSDKSGEPTTGANDDDIAQEDKPRARILAEYLAHGYTISDKTVERAIGLDNQHGFSSRFTTALQQFDAKYNASGKAKEVDQKYAITDKGAGAWAGLNSYFEKAMETPTGQKVRSFYEQGSKQVLDVHNEARRLADLKAGKSTPEQVPGTGKTHCGCGGDTSKCGCSAGSCSCSSCPKNPDVKPTADPEKTQMKKISDNPVKTSCNCGGDTGVCSCAPGECACASCPKNPGVTA